MFDSEVSYRIPPKADRHKARQCNVCAHVVKRHWKQHRKNHLMSRHKNPGELDYNMSPTDPFYGLPIRTKLD